METSSNWNQSFSRIELSECIHDVLLYIVINTQCELAPWLCDLGLKHGQENGWMDTDMFMYF